MYKIHQKYLRQAKIIRESYLKIVDEIRNKEDVVMKSTDEIKQVLKYIEDYKNNKLNRYKSIEKATIELKDELMEIDTNIHKVVNILTPLLERIEQLEKESHELYQAIKEEYPELSEYEIQMEVIEYLRSHNLC